MSLDWVWLVSSVGAVEIKRKTHIRLACENSRPSSLPAEWRFARRTSAIYRRKFHTDDVNVNFIILNKLSFAVTKGLCQAANVLHSHKCTS